MKTINKFIITGIVALALFVILTIPGAKPATANLSQYWASPLWKTNPYSTSTLAYMTPGTGTTTITVDSSIAGTGYILDEATALLAITATTTQSPTLKYRVEDSHDGIEYYARANTILSLASTTQLTGSYGEASISISTTTLSTILGSSGTTTRTQESVTVPVRARFTRFTFYVPVGGGNLGLWAQAVARSQR